MTDFCPTMGTPTARIFSSELAGGILRRRPRTPNAYLHFRGHTPLALYRPAKSCSNCGKSVGPTDRRSRGETAMKLGTAIAEIMKREGIEILCGYPVNHLIEHAANAEIRPVMVRQERIGLHMADAISRVTSGRSDRRVLHAARAGRGKRHGRRRAMLWRVRACAGAADGLCAAACAISSRTSIPARR